MNNPVKPMFDDPDRDPAAKEKLYPELARANLLRMRGEYKGAVDQCLSILKRMPEDLDAHTLIGDIYSESGDLVQAAQWYELALELDPTSQPLRMKLESVKERSQHREIAETAEQLGLPPDGTRLAIYGAMAVVIIVFIGITAYLLGQRHPVVAKQPLKIPVTAPGSPDKTPSEDSAAPDGTQSTETTPVASGTMRAGVVLPQEDRSLTVMLAQRDPLGSHIMSAMEDPRTKVLTINYTVKSDEDMKKIGAMLARSSFDQVQDALTITLRAVRDDKLSYVADMSKSKLADALAAVGGESSGADTWITNSLTYEWSLSESGNAAAGTSGSSVPPTGTSSTPASKDPSKDTGGSAGNNTTGT